jgi:hypothetical protein
MNKLIQLTTNNQVEIELKTKKNLICMSVFVPKVEPIG